MKKELEGIRLGSRGGVKRRRRRRKGGGRREWKGGRGKGERSRLDGGLIMDREDRLSLLRGKERWKEIFVSTSALGEIELLLLTLKMFLSSRSLVLFY